MCFILSRNFDNLSRGLFYGWRDLLVGLDDGIDIGGVEEKLGHYEFHFEYKAIVDKVLKSEINRNQSTFLSEVWKIYCTGHIFSH